MRRSRQSAVDDLGIAMQHYQRAVQAFDDAVGRHLGLGPADLRCLDWLTDGPRTAGQLATATGLRPAATTALIDRLESRGLLERVRSEEDRRQVLVRMTDEGRRRTWELYGPLATEGQRLLAGFTIEEMSRMRVFLDRCTEVTDHHRERLDPA